MKCHFKWTVSRLYVQVRRVRPTQLPRSGLIESWLCPPVGRSKWLTSWDAPGRAGQQRAITNRVARNRGRQAGDERKSVRLDADDRQANAARGAQRFEAAKFQAGAVSADLSIPQVSSGGWGARGWTLEISVRKFQGNSGEHRTLSLASHLNPAPFAKECGTHNVRPCR